MPVYITPQELSERIGEEELIVLSDRDGDGVADTLVIERAISDATDEINMHLAVRYQLPLTEVPETIKRLAVNLTLYWLCESDGALSDLVKTRYENSLKSLKALANGTMRLGLPELATPAENKTGDVQIVSAERRLSRTSLKGLL